MLVRVYIEMHEWWGGVEGVIEEVGRSVWGCVRRGIGV